VNDESQADSADFDPHEFYSSAVSSLAETWHSTTANVKHGRDFHLAGPPYSTNGYQT